MMNMRIDTRASQGHIQQLMDVNRSAYPVAIRRTLNSTAYDVKTRTMLRESDRFMHRKPTFFKSNSRVQQAQGFEINSMRAIVGFVPKSGDKSHSVEDLEAQEHGGKIDNRSFIALPLARAGGRWDKMVKNEAVMKRILGHLVDAKKSKANSEIGRWTKSAVFAGVGGFVISEKVTKSGGHIVFLITGINRFGGNIHTTQIPVFSVKKNRYIVPKPTHFMETASIESANRMGEMFRQYAEQKLNELRK